MTAYITDRSANPVLQFEQNFELGALSWVGDHLLIDAVTLQAAGSEPMAKALRASTSAVLSSLHVQREESPQDLFRQTALETASAAGVQLNTHRLERATKAITSYVSQTRGTVTLSNGVYLSMYDTFVGGQKTGGFLQYERHAPPGYVAYSAELNYIIDLH